MHNILVEDFFCICVLRNFHEVGINIRFRVNTKEKCFFEKERCLKLGPVVMEDLDQIGCEEKVLFCIALTMAPQQKDNCNRMWKLHFL